MNTMTLEKRLERAQRKLSWWLKELTLDIMENHHRLIIESDMAFIEQYARYIKNTCEMHGIEYSKLQLWDIKTTK